MTTTIQRHQTDELREEIDRMRRPNALPAVDSDARPLSPLFSYTPVIDVSGGIEAIAGEIRTNRLDRRGLINRFESLARINDPNAIKTIHQLVNEAIDSKDGGYAVDAGIASLGTVIQNGGENAQAAIVALENIAKSNTSPKRVNRDYVLEDSSFSVSPLTLALASMAQIRHRSPALACIAVSGVIENNLDSNDALMQGMTVLGEVIGEEHPAAAAKAVVDVMDRHASDVNLLSAGFTQLAFISMESPISRLMVSFIQRHPENRTIIDGGIDTILQQGQTLPIAKKRLLLDLAASDKPLISSSAKLGLQRLESVRE